MADTIEYSFPMNKGIRLFMRYDHLMDLYQGFADQHNDFRSAVLGLIELYELTARGDLKADLMREIDRIAFSRSSGRMRGAEAEDFDEELVTELKKIAEQVTQLRGQLGAHLKNHDFINAVRQKNAIPGGLNSFDLPIMKFWLSQPEVTLKEQLEEWSSPFAELQSHIHRYLELLRNQAPAVTAQAEQGYFAATLDTRRSYQLLSISLPSGSTVYPEPSLGRHRITLRFMVPPSLNQSPQQTEDNVDFMLTTSSTP